MAESRAGARVGVALEVETAETECDALERVRFYETCSPSVLGEWSDERTCAVDVSDGGDALEGAGAELVEYLRRRLGVIMEFDRERKRVLINHEITNVVVEAARILHLQMEQAKSLSGGDAAGAPTPTPALKSSFSPSGSSGDEATVLDIIREFGDVELEELRCRLEERRATRLRLLESLGEAQKEHCEEPIDLSGTLVRVRLPRRSFSDEKRYGVGVITRAIAAPSPSGGLTWMFQCNMGGGAVHETDIVYISNDAITIPEVCQLIHRCGSNSGFGRNRLVDEFLDPGVRPAYYSPAA